MAVSYFGWLFIFLILTMTTTASTSGTDLPTSTTASGDINACVQTPDICTNADCVNWEGSFQCVCYYGYTQHDSSQGCFDINECRSPYLNNCGENAQCANRPGSFTCDCRRGLKHTFDRLDCVDIDECSEGPECKHGLCTNTFTGFFCTCDAGFRLSSSGKHCLGEDECDPDGNTCGNGACRNSMGSHRCICDKGFILNEYGRCTAETWPMCEKQNVTMSEGLFLTVNGIVQNSSIAGENVQEYNETTGGIVQEYTECQCIVKTNGSGLTVTIHELHTDKVEFIPLSINGESYTASVSELGTPDTIDFTVNQVIVTVRGAAAVDLVISLIAHDETNFDVQCGPEILISDQSKDNTTASYTPGSLSTSPEIITLDESKLPTAAHSANTTASYTPGSVSTSPEIITLDESKLPTAAHSDNTTASYTPGSLSTSPEIITLDESKLPTAAHSGMLPDNYDNTTASYTPGSLSTSPEIITLDESKLPTAAHSGQTRQATNPTMILAFPLFLYLLLPAHQCWNS